MKHLLVLALLFTGLCSFAPDDNGGTHRPLPKASVKTLKGELMNIQDIQNDGKPILINFWATWCKPCIRELSAINTLLPDWIEETGVKVVAVSIDDARNSNKVLPFTRGKGWEFTILLDENQDLKRALNVNDIPHSFLLNGKGEIVWQHLSYAPGDENKLYEELKKVAAQDSTK